MIARFIGLVIIIVGFSYLGALYNPPRFKSNYKPDHTPTQDQRILGRNETNIVGAESYGPDIQASAKYPNLMQRFYDANKQLRLDLGIWSRRAQQDFYHANGKLSMQLGTYSDDVRANEEGLPLAGLSDNKGNIRLLFRLDGGDQSGLIIMKDTRSVNRMIMGLDINGGDYEPFLVQYDKHNSKSVSYGNPASPGNPN